MTLDELIGRFNGKRCGAYAMFKCPAHDDKQASLSVAQGPERILMKCHAGCETKAIIGAWGLAWNDVLPPREGDAPGQERRTVYRLTMPDGTPVEHIRIEHPDGSKRYTWTANGKAGLGGIKVESVPLWIPAENGSGPLVICEGEKAADAAAKCGLRAAGTVTGASSGPSVEVLAQFKGQDVAIWPDHDSPGRKHAALIAERLRGIASGVRMIAWGEKQGDDAADFLARGGTPAEALALVTAAKLVDGSPLVMIADALRPAIVELDRFQVGDRSRHVRTGIPSLDKKLGGGLRFGEVTLIGSPTGGGKTTLVVQFAMAAEEKGLAVIVSPEMSARSLAEREIVRRSGKSKYDRAPWMPPERQDVASGAHSRAFTELSTHPPNVAVYDSMDVTLDEACGAILARAKREKIAFVALDYAQQLADIESDRRYLAVGQVAHRAIQLARECDCHVVITSQVNTAHDGNTKRYAFRESAILEQKANNALLFIVEWNEEKSRIESARFETTKIRDGAQFRLKVEYEAHIFQVNDECQRVDNVEAIRDWIK